MPLTTGMAADPATIVSRHFFHFEIVCGIFLDRLKAAAP
jgi:hypothetical protein